MSNRNLNNPLPGQSKVVRPKLIHPTPTESFVHCCVTQSLMNHPPTVDLSDHDTVGLSREHIGEYVQPTLEPGGDESLNLHVTAALVPSRW